MTFRVGLLNFSKGVLSDRLIRRVDVEAYNAGLLRGENIVVLKYGGFTIRPGWRFVSETLEPGEALFPFSFSMEQTYALAFGQAYMQPLAYGGVVLEEELAIVDATNTDPVEIEIALHGYAIGDRIFIPINTVTGMTELNGRTWEVTGVPDANHIEIDADGTGWGTFISSTGGATNVSPPPPPPPPPPVPPPSPPPTPPPVGGPGGGWCVATDTAILLADGTETPASLLHVGMALRTQHEDTLEWGSFPVTAMGFRDDQALFSATFGGRELRATGDHRVWLRDGWVTMAAIGQPAGRGRVALITVADAHTYVSAGVLSHNIKYADGPGEIP